MLDNGVLRVAVDRRGLLTSVLDGDRQVLAPGRVGNLLQLHPDTPNVYDAWDIDAFYRHVASNIDSVAEMSATDGGICVVRTGCIDDHPDHHPRRRHRRFRHRPRLARAREAAQGRVRPGRDGRPLRIGDSVRHVYRPTHTNTSWDAAKFEICAHRFVHVAEPGYGVAVVNDSTYGHDVTRRPRAGGGTSTVLRLSLLRAPRSPDPETDQGRHHLRYALVPGAGIVDAAREGYRINLPEREVAGAEPVEPLVTVADDGVIVESVKLADDRSGDVVVRAYEALGARTATTLRLGFPASRADAVDLLERPTGPVELTGQDVTIALLPFQIATLRFARG